MSNFLSKLASWLLTILLVFRYKVKVRGKEVFKDKGLRKGLF